MGLFDHFKRMHPATKVLYGYGAISVCESLNLNSLFPVYLLFS
jgi:hypothetical protein